MSSSEGLRPAAAVRGPAAASPPAETSTPEAAVLGPAAAPPPAETSIPGAAVPGPAAAPPPAQTSTPTDAGPAPELTPQRIAERIAVLDAVAELPLAEHVELYQCLHAELQSALAEIDGP